MNYSSAPTREIVREIAARFHGSVKLNTRYLRTFADHLTFRDGDILSPKCPSGAPLTKQVDHFLACCQTHGLGAGAAVAPRTPADAGVAVVRILEAACASMRRGGVPVDIADGEAEDA